MFPLPSQPSLCSGHRGDDTHPLPRPLLPLLWHPLHHRSQHDHGRCVRRNTCHPYRRVGSGVCPFSAIGYVFSSCILATHCMLSSILQVRSRSQSVNANEIANGLLSALVGITAGCAFVDYWAACLIGGNFSDASFTYCRESVTCTYI